MAVAVFTFCVPAAGHTKWLWGGPTTTTTTTMGDGRWAVISSSSSSLFQCVADKVFKCLWIIKLLPGFCFVHQVHFYWWQISTIMFYIFSLSLSLSLSLLRSNTGLYYKILLLPSLFFYLQFYSLFFFFLLLLLYFIQDLYLLRWRS